MQATDLQTVYLFQGLSASDLGQVTLHCTKKDFEPGEFIYHKGEDGTEFYVIAGGKVELILEKHGNFSSLAGQISSGGHFGEVSLLTGKPRSLSVRALSKTRLLVFDAEHFKSVLLANPRIHETLDRVLAERLSQASGEWQEPESSKVRPLDRGPTPLLQPARTDARVDAFTREQTEDRTGGFGGDFELARKIRTKVSGLAALDSPVLIRGEHGTARRRVAKQIHLQSDRKSNPYVELDIREYDPWTLEGKLFGYKQDSFPFCSGRQLGILEQVHNGTLVLFHAKQISSELQQKLFDACVSGRFTCVDCDAEQVFTTRIIFVVGADSSKAGKNSFFIPELDGLFVDKELILPPLREHKQDIEPLIQFYLKVYNAEFGKKVASISPDALGMLIKYNWPGNLTELSNVIQRAVMVSAGDAIVPEQIFFGPGGSERRISFNLLRLPAIRNLFTGTLHSRLAKIVFVAFAFILLTLFFGNQEAEKNIGIVLCWYIGWPLLIISFFFLPRFWCSICALSAPGKILQKYVQPARRFPAILARFSGWIMALLCLVVFWAEIVFNAYDSPWLTGVILLSIASGALLFSVLFERYTWCRYACPLGVLNAVFSMPSILELRANREMCVNQCHDHACFRGSDTVPGCPMFRHPFLVDNNKDCILCGRCIQNCHLRSIELNLRLAPQELWSLQRVKLSDNFLIVSLGAIYFFQVYHGQFLEWVQTVPFLPGSPVAVASLLFWGAIAVFWAAYLLLSLLLAGIFPKNTSSIAAVFGYGLLPLVLGGYLAYYAGMFIRGAWRIVPNFLGLFGVESGMSEFHLLSSSGTSTSQHIMILGGMFASFYATYKIFRRLKGENLTLRHLALPLCIVLGLGVAYLAAV
jgi:transcriptional regulator with AAA-type ATPase domain/ferredoxin